MDSDNYGLVHGDFHKLNFLCDQNNKITGIDFDQVQQNWFIVDFGPLLTAAHNWIIDNSEIYKHKSKKEQLKIHKQFTVWLLEGYGKADALK
jgi:Ser/Thr protein kinase RdoA (MazF antagonist)